MLQWRKRICSFSRKSWLTKSHRRICFVVLVILLFIFTAFLIYNPHELPYSTAFLSKSQQDDFEEGFWTGKSKANFLRRIWNIVVPPKESVLLSSHLDKGTRHPFANPFKYIINEETKCQAGVPFVILMIPVASGDIEARQAVRNTWGNESLVPGIHIIRIFLLGVTSEPENEVQQKIMEESRKYHDIIQQEYLDTYHNLTIKVLMGMYWVATYCPDTPYVMKIDSDMFFNPEYLIHNLLKPELPPRHQYFSGSVMKGLFPNRNKNSKWYMPPEAYPGDSYPAFCSGTGYVFSGDLAEKIYNISLSIKHLPLEDVYMGVCLAALGIEPVSPPNESDFNHWHVSFSICGYRRLVTSHMDYPNQYIYYWTKLQQNKQYPC